MFRQQTLYEEILAHVRSTSGWFIIAWVVSAALHVLILIGLAYMQWADFDKPVAEAVQLNPFEEELVLDQEFDIEKFLDPMEPLEPPDVPDDVPVITDPIETEMPLDEEMLSDPVIEDTSDPLEALSEGAIGDVATIAVRAEEGVFGNVGVYGVRNPRRRASVGRRYGLSFESEQAVTAGLEWLARAQEADGHWDAKKWGSGGAYDLGVTGLATLCFLGAGHTSQTGKYQRNVRRAAQWLEARQAGSGSFNPATFYEQGIATMAVSELYGMTHNRGYRKMAQDAVDFIISIQPEDGGFGYGGAGADTSVTGWQIMAIKSAKLSELNVPQKAIDRSNRYLREAIDATGRTSYQKSQNGGSECMTSVGLLCRLFLNWDTKHDDVQKAGDIISKAGPALNNLYYTYYGTLSMFMLHAGKSTWKDWNKKFQGPLMAQQVTQGPQKGSWAPEGHVYGSHGGRVYTTAMAILSLEVYYRYLPVYKMK